MAITYPVTPPTQPVPARVSIHSNAATGVSVSPFTGHQQVYKYPAQGWTMDVKLPPMFRDAAEEWIAFILSLNGRYGTFYMGDPLGAAPRGIATGTPLVKGAGQSGQVLLTDGWTTSQTGIMKKGDYFQIGSNLYRCMKDADSDSGGNATLDFFPRLRATPADNAGITVTNTVGLWRMVSDEHDFDMSPGRLYDISFSAVEAF